MTRFAKFMFFFAQIFVFDWALVSAHSELLRSPGPSSISPDSGSFPATVDSLHRRAKKSSSSSKKDSSVSYSKSSKVSKASASDDNLDFYMAPTTAPVALATSQPTFGGDLGFFLDQPDDEDYFLGENLAMYAKTGSKKIKGKSSKNTASDGSAQTGNSKTSKGGTKQSKKSPDEDVREGIETKKTSKSEKKMEEGTKKSKSSKASKSEKKMEEETKKFKSSKASKKISESKKSLRGNTSMPTGSPTSVPPANYELSLSISPTVTAIESPSMAPTGTTATMPIPSSSPVILVGKTLNPSSDPSFPPTILISSDVIDRGKDDNDNGDEDGEGLKVSQKALIGSMVVLAAFVFGGLAYLFKSTR